MSNGTPTFWAAPELATLGYPVFPVGSNKQPSVRGGLYAATIDHSQLAEWIEEGREHHDVAFATGLPSGVVVADVDTYERYQWMRERYGEPHVKTKRGGHWYFRHPQDGKVTSKAIGPGLDCKGDGGYVLVPPSRGRTWTNGIPDRASLTKLPDELRPKTMAQGSANSDYAGDAIPNGSRNATLFKAASAMRRRGMGEAAIYAGLQQDNLARCQPPLDEAEVRKIAHSATRYEPSDNGVSAATVPPPSHAEATYNLTDLGNAQRFVRDHGTRVRFCYAWGKWLVYDGKRWAVDESGEVVRLMKASVRRIYGEAEAEENDKARKALDDHARRSESKTRITDALYLARSEPGVPVAPDQLDADAWLLNTASGTVDLRTGELREHRREDLITRIAPVEYDANAEAPRFSRFLREVFDDDEELVAFVRRFAGYSITGRTEERVFAILYGYGMNGKTTLVELLECVLGDYAATTDTETILAKRYQGVSNDVAALKGARLVATAEVERGRALAESKVKQLTGSDTVTARFLYAEPFSFKPEFKLWLSTNNKPVIRGTDDAIWDRIRLIPFTQRFEGTAADAKLPDKLRAELPGVLAWMVRGCLEWQREGLGEPDKVVAATEGYRAEMDVLAAFVDECCTVHPDAWCKFADLYAAYTGWCEESNEHPEKKRRFADSLTERGFPKDTGAKNAKIRRGIALRHDGNPHPTRVTDPELENGPKVAETSDRTPHISNRVTELEQNDNPQSTCKPVESNERVTEGYRKNKNFGLDTPRKQSVEKTVTIGNSVTQEEHSGEWYERQTRPKAPAPEDLLADPPDWLVKQLKQLRTNPKLFNPTASAVAAEVYGDPARWREVLPILNAYVGPGPRGRGGDDEVDL